MIPVPYDQLSEEQLLALCIWREARGELFLVKMCVGQVIVNRAKVACWWNGDTVSIRATILHPFQFSSFNADDPNADKWPEDDSQAWQDSILAQKSAMNQSLADPTDGATYYFDKSISWPSGWGKEADYENTVNLGNMRFFKPKPKDAQAPFLESE